MSAGRPGPPGVSVVVPVVNGHGDLAELYRGFSAELDRLGHSSEFIFVVGAAAAQQELLHWAADAGVIVLGTGGSLGESGALAMGLQKGCGDVVLTLAPQLQVEPSALEPAFAALAQADLVVGNRTPRGRSAAAVAFHWLLRRATGLALHDIDCGFRLMRANVARALRPYGDQHRFLAVLAREHGFSVHEIPVPAGPEHDRPGAGDSVGRFLDLFTVFFLSRYTRRPLRFFGPLGFALFALGIAIDLLVAMQKLWLGTALADRPALLLGTLLIVLGVQVFSLGLVGEIIIFTHSRHLRDQRTLETFAEPRLEGAEPAGEAAAFAAESAPGAVVDGGR